jgi:ribosomal protein S18 acetylase RimI-like enzyme
MDLTTRPARKSDTGFAREVHHRAYREVVERQFGPWVEEQQDRYFEGDWTAVAFEIVLCDGLECGYVCIEDRDDDIHVRELVLLPEYQGRGIGSSILRGVMGRARTRRVPVRLGTQHKNRALGLYRRLGFEETGRTETHVLLEWNGDGAGQHGDGGSDAYASPLRSPVRAIMWGEPTGKEAP